LNKKREWWEITDHAYTDSKILKVYEIVEDTNIYYLTIGNGSYGEGHEFDVVYLFRIDGDSLIKCNAFNNGKKNKLAIEYPYCEQGI